MSTLNWFSGTLRYVCIVGDSTIALGNDRTYIIAAPDFDVALERLVKLGVNKEESYKNAEGQDVRWRLREVVTLDNIGDIQGEGTEITSSTFDAMLGWGVADILKPEQSKPRQTL